MKSIKERIIILDPQGENTARFDPFESNGIDIPLDFRKKKLRRIKKWFILLSHRENSGEFKTEVFRFRLRISAIKFIKKVLKEKKGHKIVLLKQMKTAFLFRFFNTNANEALKILNTYNKTI